MAGNVRHLNKPLSGNVLFRAGGIASMFRLPTQETTEGLDACFVGVPFDIGTSNRSGARMGPKYIRLESAITRESNKDTGAVPYDSLMVADVGDVRFNTYNTSEAIVDIRKAFDKLIANNCKPLAMGGDHTISYPILQAMKEKYGPVGMVHIDAHSDTNDVMLGSKVTHGTPFRRAVEENLLQCDKVFQIGIRASGYAVDDLKWPIEQGFRIIPAQDCWYKSMKPLMEEIREKMGDSPVYISFDIDGLDPCYAPGTGTPEVGGLTTIQALEILRGCKGLNIIGGDLVEVSPPYDVAGMTAGCAVHMLHEMLCVLPGVKYQKTWP